MNTIVTSAAPVPWSRRWWWRAALILIVQVLVLVLLGSVMQSVSIETLGAGVVAVLVIGLLDAVVWPVATRFALPVMVLTVGIFSFVLNGVVIWLAAVVVGGFDISSVWSGVLVAVVLATVSGLLGGVLRLDDDDAWKRSVIRRAVRDRDRVAPTDVPGLLFIQIDGLSHDVLVEAMSSGHAPTIAAMLDAGHQLLPWECDLSSQTGAMQAGILHGNNENMPAFRWYDKEQKRILVSNSPSDAAEIERTQSTGAGLLAGGGASRGNVFSGDADDALFTFSQLRVGGGSSQRLVSVFATPHGLLRIIGLFVADVWRERRSARRARREGVEPHGHRGGIYPYLRASVTVGLAEITASTLAGDIYRGVPAAYCDFVGYDEVAHHSGIRRPESLDTLRRVDDRIRRLILGFEDAPRPYQIVVLSDHGQTQGATFRQRYGETLESVVQRLSGGREVVAPPVVTEGWGNVNGLLTDVANDEGSFASKVVRRTLRKRIHNGDVEIGPNTQPHLDHVDDEIIVLASGNLGLVSFAGLEGRASLEAIERAHPGLVAKLAEHPGVGFVMVRSASDDAGIVLGADGAHHLGTGEVEGEDPLAAFGPNAARHLRRTDLFTNCPDLIVNSFYDAQTAEGAAFEELIGFHGGLGGLQAAPFVIAPPGCSVPDTPIVGAERVHHLLVDWMTELRDTRSAMPVND